MGISAAVGLTGKASISLPEYPAPPTDPTVYEEYFGHRVADPYRPLENDTASSTLE